MPTDGPRTALDFVQNEMDDGISVNLEDAGAFLRRVNAIDNQFLQSVRFDGSPEFMSTFSGAVDEGFLIYATKAGGASADSFLQSSDPIDPETDVYQLLKPVIESAGPMKRGDRETYPLRNPLLPPILKAVPAPIVGLPPGLYLSAITCMGKGQKETLRTDMVEFEIVDEPGTTGKSVEWFLIPDPPEGTIKQCFYMTKPAGFDAFGEPNDPDPNTLRRQQVAVSGVRVETFDGPYDFKGKLPPDVNQTFVGNARRLRFRKDFRKRGHVSADMMEIQNFQTCMVECTPGGRAPRLYVPLQRFQRSKEPLHRVFP